MREASKAELAYRRWYKEQNPEDDPGWCLTNQNAQEAFEAGWKAATASGGGIEYKSKVKPRGYRLNEKK